MDPSRVVGDLLDDMVCSICRCLVVAPVVTSCEHFFCGSCLAQWLSSASTCPTCRTPRITQGPPTRFYRRSLDRVRLRCAQPECDVVLPLEEMPAHDQECPFREADCPNGCGWTAQQRLHAAHAGECPERLVPCDACGEGTPWRRRKSHPRSCRAVRVACRRRCGARVARGDMEQHEQTECPRALVDCPRAGCSARVPRASYAQHHDVECELAPATCGFCGASMLVGDLETHAATTCPDAPAPCALGCGDADIARRDLARHAAEDCPRAPVRCRWDGCAAEGLLRGEAAAHEAACEHRVEACELCPVLLQASARRAHRRVCGGVEVACPARCGARVARRDVQRHAQLACPRGDVACPCGAVVERRRLGEHVAAAAPGAHTAAVVDALAGAAVERGALQSELASSVAALEARLGELQQEMAAKVAALEAAAHVPAPERPLPRFEDSTTERLVVTTPAELAMLLGQLQSTRLGALRTLLVCQRLTEPQLRALLRPLEHLAAPALESLVLDGTLLPAATAQPVVDFVRSGAAGSLRLLHLVGHKFDGAALSRVAAAVGEALPRCALRLEPKDASYEVSGAGLAWVNGVYEYASLHLGCPMFVRAGTPRGSVSLCRCRLNTGRRAWYLSVLRAYNRGLGYARDLDYYRTVSLPEDLSPEVPPAASWTVSGSNHVGVVPAPLVLPVV